MHLLRFRKQPITVDHDGDIVRVHVGARTVDSIHLGPNEVSAIIVHGPGCGHGVRYWEIEDLGINFRRIASTIVANYVAPEMPAIVARYGALQQDLAAVIATELTSLRPAPATSARHPRSSAPPTPPARSRPPRAAPMRSGRPRAARWRGSRRRSSYATARSGAIATRSPRSHWTSPAMRTAAMSSVV